MNHFLAAASAARSLPTPPPSRPAFDPSTTLGWSVPLIVLALVFTFVLLVLGVRSRRRTASMAILAFLVSLAAVVLVGWARYRQVQPYTASYEWLNLAVSFSGLAQFQGFVIDLNLGVDHAGLAVLTSVLLTAIASAFWSRSGARNEAGVARMHMLMVLFVLGAAGLVLSTSLISMLVYWGLAAMGSYLLLSNRWGADETGSTRSTLVIPLAADLSFLSGVALVYSRYGDTDLSTLPGVLHSTPGAGLKSLTAGVIMIVLGAAGRAALIPFQNWSLAAARNSAPAAAALTQGVWPLLAGLVLFRVLPLADGAGPQARLAIVVLGVLSALAGPIWALLDNRLINQVTAVGLSLTGLAFAAFAYGDPQRALTALLAAAPLRAAALLAVASMVVRMRGDDVAFMAQAQRLMPRSAISLALAAGGLTVAVAAAGAAGFGSSAVLGLYGAGTILLGLAALRSYVLPAFGTLERRRTFEPSRVREAPGPLPQATLALGVVGLGFAVLGFAPAWVGFMAPHGNIAHPAGAAASLGWIVLAAAGAALAVAIHLWRRADALVWSAEAGRAGRSVLGAGALAVRAAGSPLERFAAWLEMSGMPAAETEGAGAVGAAAARLDAVSRRLPVSWEVAVAAVAAAAAVLAVLFAPGVLR